MAERGLVGDQPVERRADTEDIRERSVPSRRTHQLLGAGEEYRAAGDGGIGLIRVPGPRQPPVDDPGLSTVKNDVGWLDIQVYQAVPGSLDEPFQYFGHDPRAPAEGALSAFLAAVKRQAARYVERGHDVSEPAVFARGEDLPDVWTEKTLCALVVAHSELLQQSHGIHGDRAGGGCLDDQPVRAAAQVL